MSQDLNFNQTANLPNAVIITSTPEEAYGAIFSKKIQSVQSRHKIIISSIEEISKLCDQKKIVMPQRGFFANKIYVRNPFTNHPATYINGDSNAELDILKAKCFKIAEIAEKLGATGGAINLNSTTTRVMSRKINGDMSVSSVSARGHSDKETNFNKAVQMSFNQTWVGNSKISNGEFAKAREIATATGLIEDAEIARMLSSRDPQNTNPSTNFNYNIDLTREANQNIDAAFAIASAGYFAIDASYEKTIKESVAVSVGLSFSFPIN